jgi:four helix bundle protein
MTATTFQDLMVWQKAHQAVLEIYRMSAQFPREEMFGLTSQLRRAATSVPANIAEGFVKRSKSDKIRFYNIAQGSLEEVRYYLILARDLGYAQTDALSALIDEVSRMLEAYAAAIARSRSRLGSFFFLLLAPGFWLLS